MQELNNDYKQYVPRFIQRFFSVIVLLAICTGHAIAADEPPPPGFATWISILPPIVAIGLALITRSVIPSIFLGVWVGAWAVSGFSAVGVWTGLLSAFDTYVVAPFSDSGKVQVILFTFMVGGMVGIISRNGGMQGVVNWIVRWANTDRSGQVSTSVLGLAIFFDDYANTLIVGKTMRPVTDRLRISREKLAYLVDSTAAPVACLALVSTWIGYQVAQIGDGLEKAGNTELAPYAVFLNSIPYSFYPILAIFFVLLVASTRRDFGPMLHAEQRARTSGEVIRKDAEIDEEAVEGKDLVPVENKPHRAINALIPILVLLVTVIAGLFVTGGGENKSIADTIADADSYAALMWGSLASTVVAALLSWGQRVLTLEGVVQAWYAGLRTMMYAMIILVLAWALSEVSNALGTPEYMQGLLKDSVAPGVFPALVFLVAAGTAFGTGSSWSTMAILMPLVVPLALAFATQDANMAILFSAVACVLSGSVWGDHCSPISDTTVLSSMASGCDHIDHVRTQLPYALLTGAAALLLGTLPAGFGLPWWGGLLLGAVALIAVNRLLARPLPEPQPS